MSISFDKEDTMHWKYRIMIGIALLATVVCSAFLISKYLQQWETAPSENTTQIPSSDFLNKISDGTITRIDMYSNILQGHAKDAVFQTYTIFLNDIVEEARKKNVPYQEFILAPPAIKENSLASTTIFVVHSMIIIGILFWMGYGFVNPSGGKDFLVQNPKTTFDDVAGIPEIVEEVSDLVTFLKNPKKFTDIGARIPKGTIFHGPSGSGKTLLARAIAGEAEVSFFSIAGSAFVQMYVGVGAARVRQLFAAAEAAAPSIIFIDEIDAVGGERSNNPDHSEQDSTLNQLLVAMDGFKASKGVIVIGATNRIDTLDPALLRPGRFDRRVYVPHPDIQGRQAVILVHGKKIAWAHHINLEEYACILAKKTPRMSGAEIENLLNEAAIHAAKFDRLFVDYEDIDYALDRLKTGLKRKSNLLSDDEKRRIAVHEAGHALVSKYQKCKIPVERVSIIPREQALGVTEIGDEEHQLQTTEQFTANIIALLGGRAAEEVVLSSVSSGASDDLERASMIALNMVTFYGMSDAGILSMPHNKSSETRGTETEKAAQKILNDAYEEAKNLIKNHQKIHGQLVTELLEKETVGPEQLAKIFV